MPAESPAPVHGKRLLVRLFTAAWMAVACALTVYIVFPGILIGLLARVTCVDASQPTGAERETLRKYFWLPGQLASRSRVIGRFYEWQAELVIKPRYYH